MGGEENITSLLLKLERVHRAPNTGSRRRSQRPVPFLPPLVQSPQQQKCCLLEKKPLTPRFRRLRAQAPGPDCLCPCCVSATSWRVALDKLLITFLKAYLFSALTGKQLLSRVNPQDFRISSSFSGYKVNLDPIQNLLRETVQQRWGWTRLFWLCTLGKGPEFIECAAVSEDWITKIQGSLLW